MRRRTSPATEISVSTTEISVTGMKIFPYEHFIPVTGMKKIQMQSHISVIERTILYYYDSFLGFSSSE